MSSHCEASSVCICVVSVLNHRDDVVLATNSKQKWNDYVSPLIQCKCTSMFTLSMMKHVQSQPSNSDALSGCLVSVTDAPGTFNVWMRRSGMSINSNVNHASSGVGWTHAPPLTASLCGVSCWTFMQKSKR